MNKKWSEYSSAFPNFNSRVCNRLYVDATGKAWETPGAGRVEIVKAFQEGEYPMTRFIPASIADPYIVGNTIKRLPIDDIRNIVVIGASLMDSAFGRDLVVKNTNATNDLISAGVTNVDVYGWGWSSHSIFHNYPILSKVNEAFNAFNNNDTLFIFHIGGNDVTADRPFSSLSPADVSNWHTQISEFMDYIRVEKPRYHVLFSDLTFRTYPGVGVSGWNSNHAASVFDSDTVGSRPFIDTFFRPNQILLNDDYINSDGNSVMDLYNWTRNNYVGIFRDSSDDGVHFRASSYVALRKFMMGRVAEMLLTKRLPNPIVPAVRRYDCIINFGRNRVNTASLTQFPYAPNNFIDWTSPVDMMQLRTPTGHEFGFITMGGNATVTTTQQTITPSGLEGFDNNGIYNSGILYDSLVFSSNSSFTLTIQLFGLASSRYTLKLLGSSSEYNHTTTIEDIESVNSTTFQTGANPPQEASLTCETSGGQMSLTLNSNSVGGMHRVYLSGLQLIPQ